MCRTLDSNSVNVQEMEFLGLRASPSAGHKVELQLECRNKHLKLQCSDYISTSNKQREYTKITLISFMLIINLYCVLILPLYRLSYFFSTKTE